jgi:hypothetical protein
MLKTFKNILFILVCLISLTSANAQTCNTAYGCEIAGPVIMDKTLQVKGHTTSSALDIIAKTAMTARNNNPRINSIMSAPPVITQSGSASGSLTKLYQWNTTLGIASINMYGGKPTDDGAGYAKFPVATVSGSGATYTWRAESKIDATAIQIKILNITACVLNFIVDGHYVSYTPLTVNAGAQFITLDFTTVGGRAARNIIIEGMAQCDFFGEYVLPTETISNPGGTVIRAYVVGDSMTNTGGLVYQQTNWASTMCDMLGIRDCWNGAVGGQGIITQAFGNSCASRISDIINAAPQIIFLTCGRDDIGVNTPAAVQTAMLAWLKAIRLIPLLQTVPIIVSSTYGNLIASNTQPMEIAIAAAVTAFNDPYTFMILDVTSSESPIITTTSASECIGATNGLGNADVYIHTDCIHYNGPGYAPTPNNGHFWFANKFTDKLLQQVFQP